MRGIITGLACGAFAAAIGLTGAAQAAPITCTTLDVAGGSSPQSPTLVPAGTCDIGDMNGANLVHVNDNNPRSTYEFGWDGGDLTITVQLTSANNSGFTVGVYLVTSDLTILDGPDTVVKNAATTLFDSDLASGDYIIDVFLENADPQFDITFSAPTDPVP